jgi:uncharacterized Zn finger protein
MNWNDVDGIIYNGTLEEINSVKCPVCGGKLKLRYSAKAQSVSVECLVCGAAARHSGVTEAPNFALLQVAG